MGALILVAGANGSGKSLFAEELVEKTWGDRYYIATMAPQTEENFQRVEKHRRQREHLAFGTSIFGGRSTDNRCIGCFAGGCI